MQEATPPAAIILKNLEKFYAPPRSGIRAFLQPFERATRPALKGVSFEVTEGEAVALLGANGAGKSTILRILATLLLPTRGQAFVSGHDTAKDARAVRRRLGYHAGSDPGFYPRLTGRQNLLFFGQLNHLTEDRGREAHRGIRREFSSCRSAGRNAFSGDHTSRLAASRSKVESHDSRAERHARGTSWRRSPAAAASGHRAVAALRDCAASGLDARLLLDPRAHKNHRHAFSPLTRASLNIHGQSTRKKKTGDMFRRPSPFLCVRFQDFFFLVVTLVAIPGAIWLSISNPCFACWPHGPLGSRSMACW